MPAALTLPPWCTDLGQRLRRLFWLKLIGTSLWVWVFFLGYFALLHGPTRPMTTMPLTALDRWIEFQGWALWPYLSLWFYVGLAPGLLRDFRTLCAYGCWAAALCATGLLCFYLWPTQIPPLPLPAELPSAMAMLKGVDAGGNACPSMHVAAALFSACWIAQVLCTAGAPRSLQVLNLVWLLAIVWSTLAVRQHVLLDVAGGVLLGSVYAWASLRWHPRERSTCEGTPRVR